MPDNQEQIRTLVERWAEAVHSGDMDGVLADHSDDIVMFDVPPPYEGARGIDAYRDTWPPFFEWQEQGASFEIVSLDVTAGDDVAYAHALLRCGTPQDLAENPANRLRLTLGLRKEQGRWVVAHEHHSFPDTTVVDAAAAEREPTRHTGKRPGRTGPLSATSRGGGQSGRRKTPRYPIPLAAAVPRSASSSASLC
ncbi:nuclear transport factor 2 family protein [Allosalinactinospora lopnorensis]|uniref:nuclear transport factor 2 family protein n=1 Tax=Allosalinactinospora lopnorensis TaxID=1352348 RepID=UPI000AC64452|nr:nuclear transport factor 2 family protein [Allosalinactinospora lopnorensis]